MAENHLRRGGEQRRGGERRDLRERQCGDEQDDGDGRQGGQVRFDHRPVLADECLSYLAVKPGGVYVDGTVGGAGHAVRILERLGPGGVLVGIDRDDTAVKVSEQRLRERNETLGGQAQFYVVHGNFADIDKICRDLHIPAADGILLDLGVSSHQLDEAERGFSYQKDAPLDMRMDRDAALCAADIVNTFSERELTELIGGYGEERWAARIGKFIVERRAERPIATTAELAEIIRAAIPKEARRDGPHPAKRTFQAIRIAVNDELNTLEGAIERGAAVLAGGGRFCVISFHSLEDRIVKNAFRELSTDCLCPKSFPVCVCGHRATVSPVTKKPVLPDAKEVAENPRARSAKLRVAEKL
jgi:16S rRNA (cytosine1402-N4)-methyltransferase